MTVCSVLIPTRIRVDGLHRAVRSAFDTASDIEVVLRVDEDDNETLSRLGEFEQYGSKLRTKIGPRLRGYGSLNIFFTELARIAEGKWISIFNDDSWYEGSGWDVELATLPTSGFIVHPEVVGNGPCRYSRTVGGPFPIVPNLCWDRFKYEGTAAGFIGQPADDWFDWLLRRCNGWHSHFLSGLTILHERDPDFMVRRQGNLAE